MIQRYSLVSIIEIFECIESFTGFVENSLDLLKITKMYPSHIFWFGYFVCILSLHNLQTEAVAGIDVKCEQCQVLIYVTLLLGFLFSCP